MTTITESAKTIRLAVVAALALHAPLEGGRFNGITTLPDGRHVAVVLLPERPDGRKTWQESVDWAESVGGELMSRPVAALLFANDKDEFEKNWHWLAETYSWDSSCAWRCHFDSGHQNYGGKSYAGSARAVRLIHIID